MDLGASTVTQAEQAQLQADSQISPRSLLYATNRLRSSEKSLVVNQNLQQAAQAKAEFMASEEYFAHVSTSGKTPWQWMDEYGYRYRSAGENLAVNFETTQDVIQAWLDSPTHRRNMEDEHYSEIGIGLAFGVYQNQPQTLYIVAMYGEPKAKANTHQGWFKRITGVRDFLNTSKK